MTQEQLNLKLFTAVRDAICNNNLEAVKKAIEDGADVNALDGYGKTPLEIAELYKHTEIIELLKHYGGIGMNTITLPNHISFEEVACIWCDADYDRRSIHYAECEEEIISRFVEYQYNACLQTITLDFAAEFHSSNRTFTIHDEKDFYPILYYIKERSNGQNERNRRF